MEEIQHGNCLQLLKKIEAESVDTIVADPPYSVPATHFYSMDMRWNRKWSDVSVMQTWWEQVVKEMKRVLKPTGHLFAFCNADSYAAFYPAIYSQWQNVNCLVWDKMTPGMGNLWRRQHELIITGRNRKSYRTTNWGSGDVLKHRIVPASRRHHPAEKPVALLLELIQASTPPGGIVCDPFAGSGSTLVAAQQGGFSYIGMEMEKEYVEITKKRLIQEKGSNRKSKSPQ